jgi:DNA-binding transcriptional MerR regulator
VSWQTEAAEVAPRAARAGADRDDLSIAEVRSLAGISARTLRYYEELGLLPGVRRRAGGRRIYGPDELERLRFISRLKALGLSLAEIKELNAVYGIGGSTRAMLARLDELLARHRADVEARIAELEGLRDEIDAYRDHVGRRIGRASANGSRRKR